MPIDEDRAGVIADEITRYLAQHPGSADTFDGIARWWITRIRFDEAVDEVRGALDILVLRGVVVAEALADGSLLYRSAIH